MKFHIYTCIFLIAAMAAAVAIPASAKARRSAKSKTFTVVIDAGHGGKDTGAVDNAVKEKDINLSVAKALQEKLNKEMKNIEVVMTRDNDSFISLQGRADKANQAKADLFISIHTNSVDAKNPNRKNVAGASVYALGLHKEGNNMAVARRENSVIALEKNYEQTYKGFNPDSDESYMLFEMANKQNLMQSIRFAKEAQRQLVSTAGRKDRGVHQAGFWVLWATAMPSVLIELDFICNPNSAKYMASAQGSEKLAEAIFNAIKKYRVQHEKITASTEAAKHQSADAPALTPSSEAILLSASETPDRKVTEAPRTSGISNNSVTKRRRRSATARETSEKRVLEAETAITVKTHTRTTRAVAAADRTVAAVTDTGKSSQNTSPSKTGKPKKGKNQKASSTSKGTDGPDRQKSRKNENKRTRVFNNRVITLGPEKAENNQQKGDLKESIDSKVASRFKGSADKVASNTDEKVRTRESASAASRLTTTSRQTNEKSTDGKSSSADFKSADQVKSTVTGRHINRGSLHGRGKKNEKKK